MNKFVCICTRLLFLFAAITSFPSPAQTAYPQRHVRIITAGAGTTQDLFTRHLARRLSERWGKPVIVDNQPAAALTIGTSMAARAAPDGYTLLLADRSPLTVAPIFYKDLKYDPVKDLTPIILVGIAPMIVVTHPSFPAKNLQELIQYAKLHPGAVNYATAGSGTAVHMTGELLNQKAGIAMAAIPYVGGTAGLFGVVSGQVQVGFGSAASTMPLVTSGKLKAITVAAAKRMAAAPDVPSSAEAGLPGFESAQWFGLLAPTGTPAAIVSKINRDAAEILEAAETKAMLVAQGVEFTRASTSEFASFIAAQTVLLRKLAESAGMHGD